MLESRDRSSLVVISQPLAWRGDGLLTYRFIPLVTKSMLFWWVKRSERWLDLLVTKHKPREGVSPIFSPCKKLPPYMPSTVAECDFITSKKNPRRSTFSAEKGHQEELGPGRPSKETLMNKRRLRRQNQSLDRMCCHFLKPGHIPTEGFSFLIVMRNPFSMDG